MAKWLWQYIKRYRFRMALGLLLTVLVSGLNMVNPRISGQLVDRVVLGDEKHLIWLFISIIIGTTLIKALIRYSYQMVFEHVSQNTYKAIREDCFAHLHRQDFAYFDKTRTGDLMTALSSDLEAIRHFTAWVIYQLFENIVVFIFAVSVLFSVNWQLSLVLLTLTPFIGLFVTMLMLRVKPMFAKIRAQFSSLNTRVQENISGNRVVRAFTREDFETQRFEKENTGFQDANLESARVWGTFIPLIDTCTGLMPVLLILVGGIFIIHGKMSMGDLVVFNGLIWAITQPLNMLGWLINDVQRFRASAERVYAVYQVEPRILLADRAWATEKTKGEIEFKSVSFSYGEAAVLNDLSFKIEAGSCVGILGPTGSGKSTISRLIPRWYEASKGQILVDGIDVKNWDIDSLRANVGVAMQDPFLFSDSIEGNIAFADITMSDERVRHAAKLAVAHDFVTKTSEGYQTVVGERGVGLSGGQRQRLTLARLIAADTPIMILDDTTSSVDLETEEKIRASIEQLKGQHTILIIAHRISSLKIADSVMVIENGRLSDRGSHRELIARPGYYRNVWLHQIGGEHGAQ